VNEVIMGLAMYLCQNDSACMQKVDDCVTQKYWEYYEYAVNRDVSDQLILDFTYECHEELR
jgi:hypothetical protein